MSPIANPIRTIADLKAAYPYQFTSRTYEMSLTQGWFYGPDGFVQLCHDIDELLQDNGEGTMGFTWLQCKEKFGTGRYHFTCMPAQAVLSDHPEKIDVTLAIAALTFAAGNATGKMCICCGKAGQMDDYRGYYLTLCDNHKAQRHAGLRLSIYLDSDNEVVGQPASHPTREMAPIKPVPRGADQPILYLDYDGVLHPENVYFHPKRGAYLKDRPGHTLFEQVDLLIELLAPYPAVRIVLSTSWVRVFKYSKACERLPMPLQQRVIGATWHSSMKSMENEWSCAPRGMQVYGDAVKRKPAVWLAIDDDWHNWPKIALGNLVSTDETYGIAHPEVKALLIQKLATSFGSKAIP